MRYKSLVTFYVTCHISMVIEPAPSISKGDDSMEFPGLRKISQ